MKISSSYVPNRPRSKIDRVADNFAILKNVDDRKEDQLDDYSDVDESLPNPEGVKGTQQLGNKEVLVADRTGSQKVVKAAEKTPKSNPRTPKKKNMNEEAANYYSYMSFFQERMVCVCM